MTQRFFIYLVYVVLMLIAQHGALTHSVWHLSENLPVQHLVEKDADSQVPDRSNGPTQSKLCDLHIVMNSLLAGDCASPSIPDAALLLQSLATSFAVWRVGRLLLTPLARAPPVLL